MSEHVGVVYLKLQVRKQYPGVVSASTAQVNDLENLRRLSEAEGPAVLVGVGMLHKFD